MRFTISLLIAILIHAGSILAMATYSNGTKTIAVPSQRIVTRARIIRVSTSTPQKIPSPQAKPKAEALAKKIVAKNIPLVPAESQKSPQDSQPAALAQTASDSHAAGEDTDSEEIPTVDGSPANYRSNPSPSYPKISIRMREEGRVIIKALVNKDGKVEKCELATSSGFERLDSSALEAVQRWLFIAQERNGKPISSWVIVPVVFSLKT